RHWLGATVGVHRDGHALRSLPDHTPRNSMTIQTRDDYEHSLAALGICVTARIPVLLWGNPGEGKTATVESAKRHGWHVETVIITHFEPSDFAGLPIVSPSGQVTLAPSTWAVRLAEVD